MSAIALLFLAAALASGQPTRPLIAIAGINHESNTFNPRKTGLDLFTRRDIRPEEFLRETAKSNSTTSGFISGARQYGFDVYPVFDTEAPPFAYSVSKSAKLRPHLKAILETLERTAKEITHG